MALPVALCMLTGCASSKVDPPPAANPIPSAAPAQAADPSWSVADYVRIGIPDPNCRWTAADYRACRDVLYSLDRTNRAAMPRMDSPNSGLVFARLINPTNTLPLAECLLPARERIRFYFDLVNLFPAFLHLYDPGIEPVLHRESLELNHAFLRMLHSAADLDNRPLPLAAGETTPTTFRVFEFSRTRIEEIRGGPLAKSLLPQSDQRSVLGALGARSMQQVLPWLADGARLPESERLAGARYLGQDVPALWKHIVPATQQDLLQELDGVLRHTTPETVRHELESLRIQISPAQSHDQ